MSPGIIVLTKHWNSTKQRVKELSGYFDYPVFNVYLNNLENAVRKAELQFLKRQIVPSVLELKSAILKIISGESLVGDAASLTLYKYLNTFITTREVQGILATGTIQGYKQLQNVLGSFQNGKVIRFTDLSVDRLNDLTKHMVDNFDYGTNQINKIQRRLRTVINSAITAGYQVNSGTNDKSWRVRTSSLNDKGVAFTINELKLIEAISLQPKLERVRDRFFIGVETGQRYSDFKSLNEDSVLELNGKRVFNIVQQKTNKVVKIPVSKRVECILKRYNGSPPIISEQNFNKYLKEMCKMAGLNGEFKIRKENPIHGITSTVKMKKYEIVSSHDCRRTFATIAHNKGIPPAAIMKITGHSNLKTFSDYLKIDLSKNMELDINAIFN